MPADPNALPNLRPDITGSGVDIKSVRSHGPGLVNTIGAVPVFVGANDLTTIPPAYLPFYTTSQGTSFSCPQVSGVVALMLEANPLLTPDDVVTILRQTATPMPYEQNVVGSGYVDAHNAVRSVMGLPMVAHPADLFPHTSGGPQIVDVSGDQFGTDAQDILSAQYTYDAANNQIVYTLTLANLSNTTTNMQWFMSSDFQLPSNLAAPVTTLYISAATGTGTPTFEYGTIIVSNGIRNQTTLGTADGGEIRGNQVIVRLSLDKVNAAVGYNVTGTTSAATEAIAQILLGTDATGGLLLAADTASGSDFRIIP